MRRRNENLITRLLPAVLALGLCLALSFPASAGKEALPDAPDADTGTGTPATTVLETMGGFTVLPGTTAALSYRNGVLTVRSGRAELAGGAPGDRIDVRGDTELTLSGADIRAKGGAGITVSPGSSLRLVLAGGTSSHVRGADNYAGIEVACDPDRPASLVILGEGQLSAEGGANSAGIGGSYAACALYGDVTIEGGTVTAAGGSNAAGIGSAVNTRGDYAEYRTPDAEWGVITVSGGTVIATGAGSGAGIGGGNHADGGRIVISGGTVFAEGAAGIGSGTGSANAQGDGSRGPGYFSADIEITGGAVTATAAAGSNGAGIGGGMYCDAVIRIGGSAQVTAQGGSGTGSVRHGGAGIGGGCLGHGDITIGGEAVVTAMGGGGAAGIGSGAAANTGQDRGNAARGKDASLKKTTVTVSGTASVTARGGDKGGAGIGGGAGADKVKVTIDGGTAEAYGAKGLRGTLRGGAGVGSGYSGLTAGEGRRYFVRTDTEIEISGGKVTATGGWGAAAVGGGDDNDPAAKIAVSAEAKLTAFSDGTRPALDTGPDAGERKLASVIQGCFPDLTRDYEDPRFEGAQVVFSSSWGGGDFALTLPGGYRCFAASVAAGETEDDVYTLHTREGRLAPGSDDHLAASPVTASSRIPADGGFADRKTLIPVTDVRVAADWADADNADGSRASAELVLVRDEEEAGRLEVSPAGGAEIVWEDLPLLTPDAHGTRSYRVEALAPEGYEALVSGGAGKWEAEFRHEPDAADVTVELRWADGDGAARPESVLVTLRCDRGEDRIRTAEVAPDGNGRWIATFPLVPRSWKGAAVLCSVTEAVPEGYIFFVSETPEGFLLTQMAWP